MPIELWDANAYRRIPGSSCDAADEYIAFWGSDFYHETVLDLMRAGF